MPHSTENNSIQDNLARLNITIPTAAAPVANYIGATLAGNLLFTSGQLPMADGGLKYKGILGKDISSDDAVESAKLCAINVLAQAQALLGDLNKIDKLVKLTVFIASSAEFTSHPAIANGASDLFVEILGEQGKHTRSAVGVAALPMNAPVEIEAVFLVK